MGKDKSVFCNQVDNDQSCGKPMKYVGIYMGSNTPINWYECPVHGIVSVPIVAIERFPTE